MTCKKTILLLLLLALIFVHSASSALPQRPNPPRLVNDFENLLNRAQRNVLENKLLKYEQNHGTQIAIVITRNLHNLEIADFGARLAEDWGVGRADFENGVLITVVPGDEQGRRLVNIAVGYGLESVIPDALAQRIIDNEIIPAFRQSDYFSGLNQATDVVMQLASGEFTAAEYEESVGAPSILALIMPFLIIALIIFLVSRKSKSYSSPGKAIPGSTLFWLLTHSGRGRSGSYGNFRSGTGSFGRSGGSSFGGFGGGRFGGGGASGSW